MRVLIVGGGLSGLVCANLCADRGMEVTVVDRAGLGGRGRSTSKAGCTWNLGAHALYRAGHAARVLAGLGIGPVGAVPAVGSVVTIGEEVHAMPLTPWSLLTSKAAADARLALARLFVQPASAPEGCSVRHWFDALGLVGNARVTAEAFVRVSTYANAPDDIDASAVGEQIALAAKGVLYLDGGWQQLVDALVERARARGVTLREKTAVDAMHEEEDGVHVDGLGRWDRVVLALPPRAAARFFSVEMDCVPARTATLDMVWDALPRPDRGFALGADEPFYFSVASQTAKLASEGKHVVHVMAYLPPGERIAREAVDAWVDRVQPGWRDHVVAERWLPDLEVTGALARVSGGRPGVQLSARVFRCGDAYGDRGMLADAGMASAEEVAHALTSVAKVAA